MKVVNDSSCWSSNGASTVSISDHEGLGSAPGSAAPKPLSGSYALNLPQLQVACQGTGTPLSNFLSSCFVYQTGD